MRKSRLEVGSKKTYFSFRQWFTLDRRPYADDAEISGGSNTKWLLVIHIGAMYAHVPIVLARQILK